jgi:hypothetical protein
MRVSVPLFCSILLLATAAWSGTGPSQPAIPSAPEPSGKVTLAAREISRVQEGPGSRIVLEVTLHSRLDLAKTRVDLVISTERGTRRELPLPNPSGALRSRAVRKIRHEVTLATGHTHHLKYTAVVEDHQRAVHQTTAYMRLNLDPDTEPEDLGDILQFRARTDGR